MSFLIALQLTISLVLSVGWSNPVCVETLCDAGPSIDSPYLVEDGGLEKSEFQVAGLFDAAVLLQMEGAVAVEHRSSQDATQPPKEIAPRVSPHSVAAAGVRNAVPVEVNASPYAMHVYPHSLKSSALSELLCRAGHLPQRTPCTSGHASMLSKAMRLSMYMGGATLFQPWMLLALYAIICVCVLGSIFYGVWRPYSKIMGPKWPMAEAWRQGFWTWILSTWVLDFATVWIRRWGSAANASSTVIRPEELECIGYPEDEVDTCYQKFQQVWQEEAERSAQHQVSLLRTIIRFVTWKKLGALVLWNGVFETLMFLMPPLAVQCMTNYLNWLNVGRSLGHTVLASSLVGPSVLFILMFTGIPLGLGFANTMSAIMAGRLSLRVCSAISCAIYKKAQRLPVSQSAQDTQDSNAALLLAPSRIPLHTHKMEKKESGVPVEEFGDLVDKDDLPSQFNLTQLVLVDVDTNVVQLLLAFGRIAVMIPLVATMFTWVCIRLRAAFFIAVGAVVVMLCLLIIIGLTQRQYIGAFMNGTHARLEFFQNIFYGIRQFKSAGEELRCQKMLDIMREQEMGHMNRFFACLCLLFCVHEQFPNVILISSLGGLCLFYGDVSATEIFTIIPLMSSFQGSVTSLTGLIPLLVTAFPSLTRIEGFLKLSEAPPFVIEQKFVVSNSDHVLTMQGDFARSPHDVLALRNVNISVRPGELIAVLGQVGSGKTTLLHGMLGELYPMNEARQQLPRKIAYSAQVAYIVEGTMKANVIHGELYDEERYNEAMLAACLLPDVKVLPGGAGALIGSQGIMLSGGQKARVSMARVAYSFETHVVLLDDPFGAVDWDTASQIMDNLVCGPLLRSRARVITMQPDGDLLQRFDRVLIMVDGMVRVDGSPDEAMATPEYEALLLAHGCTSQNEDVASSHGNTPSSTPCVLTPHQQSQSANNQLREEEFQGRANVSTFLYFFRMGGWTNFYVACFWNLSKNVFDIMERMTLSSWTTSASLSTAGISAVPVVPATYFAQFGFWWILSIISWFIGWSGGQIWSLRISRGSHQDLARSLLRAPIGLFYDKTPVGRIMTRLTQDQVQIDTQLYIKIFSGIALVYSLCVPIGFVHFLMPIAFTLVALPVYLLAFTLIRMYWRTMVPLRYALQNIRAIASAELTEIETTNDSVRAFLTMEQRFRAFQTILFDVLKTNFIHDTVLKRWLSCRLYMIIGFFVTWISLIAVWVEDALDVGDGVFCILQVFMMIVVVDSIIDLASSAQYQIVAMNRLHEYTMLPQEKPDVLPTDSRFADFVVTLSRRELGDLHMEKDFAGVWHVLRKKPLPDVILNQLPGRQAFVAPQGYRISELCPSCKMLCLADDWHRVVAVNGINHSAEEVAHELCYGTSEDMTIQVRSGWLADGVAVAFEDVRAGYADFPRDVLSHVTFNVPRRSKVAIFGQSGCGKSTMLLTIMRIVEPRGGRILLEGEDTQLIGLRTLRSAMAVVPQDPVLMQGTLRSNIDPFSHHSDTNLWRAIRLARLEEVINGLDGGLNCTIAACGSNLSFGQRQLVSFARILLKEPMLLMLDEATSAIDPRSQEAVLSTLLAWFPESTMLVVTHRLQTILMYDLGIIMDKGSVVECRPVNELVYHSQSFRKLKSRLR